MPRKRTGFAVVMAVFLVMVCLLVATAMIALAQFDLRNTTLRALSVQRYFAARGQVQELLVRIHAGESLSQYEATPLVADIHGISVEARVVADTDQPEIHHLRARADDAESAETTVFAAEPVGAGTFAGILNPGTDYNYRFPQRFVTQHGNQDWRELPEIIWEAHGPGGAVIPAETLCKRYVADTRGHLFITTTSNFYTNAPGGVGLFRYETGPPEAWVDLGTVPRAVPNAGSLVLDAAQGEITPLGSNPYWRAGLGGARSIWGNATFLAVSRTGSDFYDRINYGTGPTRCAFRHLNLDSRSWKLIAGPLDSAYDPSSGAFTQQTTSGIGGFIAGDTNRGVYCITNNVVAHLADPDSTPPNWQYLPIVPKHYYDQSGVLHKDSGTFGGFGGLTVGPKGEVYVSTSGEAGVIAISCFRDGRWNPVFPPLDAPNWSVGGYMSVDNNGNLFLEHYHESKWYMRFDGEVWRTLPKPTLEAGENFDLAVGGANLEGKAGRLVKKVSW